MRDMIYYPGFEIQDTTWLKFALLYFDNLRPIIPYTTIHKREYYSDTFQRIMDETDLINPYAPQYNEGMCASALACEIFEKYLSHPERYGAFFGRPYARSLVEKWQNPEHQNCTLFEGKYSHSFVEFCISNKIATPCREGIQISNELAFIYMSLLADVISRNNELEMITDNTRYSSILLKKDMLVSRSLNHHLNIARNNIEFSIPGNLSNIPIETIIQLRGQKNFNDLRKAYMGEIENLIASKERQDAFYSLGDMLSYKREFIKICESSLAMIAAATLTVYSFSALGNGIQGSDIVPLAATVITDYKATKDALSEIPQFIDRLKTKHMAKKYVAKVNRLNTPYKYRE